MVTSAAVKGELLGIAVADVRPPRQHAAAFAEQLVGSLLHGPGVAAVAVDQDDPGGPIGTADELDDQLLDDIGADRQRAWETGVFTAGGRRQGRTDQHIARLERRCQTLGQGDGDPGVGVEWQVWPVLLARSDGDGDDRPRGKVPEVRPRGVAEPAGHARPLMIMRIASW